ncbi:MAG: AAA family ATPase, partial [Chloroflexota bacterium]|nr:AAA family ATPase [Chloroflexota bacterium]
RIRGKWSTNDNRYLKEDAGNIAPFLLRMREDEASYYQRIVDTVRLILPFFSDFELEPENGHLLLVWRERNSDQVFDVSQASDGMLRVIALVALLLQPEKSLPDVLILDEPELGLHPSAITVIGGLIRAVSTKAQVIVATQSAALVDCFEAADIVVVEREDRKSVFRRLDAEVLGNWLEDYTLSELWDKNVLGGRP